MKPYGLNKKDTFDTDVMACRVAGRASAVYNLPGKGGDVRAYRGLRNGKKAETRRYFKRRERMAAKANLRDFY